MQITYHNTIAIVLIIITAIIIASQVRTINKEQLTMDRSQHAMHESNAHVHPPSAHSDHSMMMSMPTTLQWTTQVGEVILPQFNVHDLQTYIAFSIFIMGLCIVKEYLYAKRLDLLKMRDYSAISFPLNTTSSNISNVPLSTQAVGPSARLLPADDVNNKSIRSRHPASNLLEIAMTPSVLYGMNLFISYIIMLVVMTYNVGFIVVIVLSSVLSQGYFDRLNKRAHWNRISSRTANVESFGGSRHPSKRYSSYTDLDKGMQDGEMISQPSDGLLEEELNRDCCER